MPLLNPTLFPLPQSFTDSAFPCDLQGDLIEWCFYSEKGTHEGKRQRQGPRRVGITIASVSSPKVIGRALSFAKAGEPIDLLIKQ